MINIKKFRKKNNIPEKTKLFISGILILLTIISNYYINISWLIHIIISITLSFLAIKIFILTKPGKKGLNLIKDTLNEIDMIIWPTFKNTLNTTFIVLLITIIMALILWGLDNLLIHFISFITSLRL